MIEATEDAVDAGYPKAISENWGITGPIDAIFQRTNGKIYIFKGDQYYRVTDKYYVDGAEDKPDAGYPQKIADKFEGKF